MELEVPPCSDSELALLLAKWSERAESREPLALAMARAFARASDTAIAADIPRETDSRARRLIASAMIGLSPIDRAAR